MYLTNEVDVFYISDEDIGGFQFDIDEATVSDASGGYAAADVLQMRDHYVLTGLISSLGDLSSPDDLGSDDLLGEFSSYDMTSDGHLGYQDM